MKQELENELYNIDPVFFNHAIACKNGTENETQTCMAFGCECGDGWFEPIKEFVKKVAVLNKNGSFHFVCHQLKEKYGELRVYYGYEDVNGEKGVVPSETQETISKLFEDALHKAEDDCWNTCERCGKPNDWKKRDVVTTSGWISRLCRDCAQSINDKEVERFDQNEKREHHPRIVDFRSGYDFLSMWHKHRFHFRGFYYESIWSAYFVELLKDKIPGFKEEFGYGNVLLSIDQPGVAYHLGKALQKDISDDIELMKSVLHEKYKDDFLKEWLLKTKGKEIVFFNQVDSFWGVIAEKEKSDNMFGKLLAEVRDEFENEKQD